MAMVTSTIANRGISFHPKLVYRVLDQKGKDVRDDDNKIVAPHEPQVRADLHTMGITNDQIEAVRRGMWKVVNEAGGTGKRAQVKNVQVAGKTGTAQFWRETKDARGVLTKVKDNHTWFICFAPYEDPKYAICVMVQGAKSGGGVSAPIAQHILEESLALEKGYDPGLKPLDPAVGQFRPDRKCRLQSERSAGRPGSRPGDGGALRNAAEDEDRKADRAPRPNIRSRPDRGGRVPQRATPAQPPADRRGFFQKFFGRQPSNQRPAPAPAGRPGR